MTDSEIEQIRKLVALKGKPLFGDEAEKALAVALHLLEKVLAEADAKKPA
jgi:hypothetical protein